MDKSNMFPSWILWSPVVPFHPYQQDIIQMAATDLVKFHNNFRVDIGS